jgi:hypothetical protein
MLALTVLSMGWRWNAIVRSGAVCLSGRLPHLLDAAETAQLPYWKSSACSCHGRAAHKSRVFPLIDGDQRLDTVADVVEKLGR